MQRVEKYSGLFYGHSADVSDGPVVNAHGARLGTQARSTALRAERVSAITAQKHAHVQLIFFPFQQIEKTLDATKPFVRVALQDQMLLLWSQIAVRHINWHAMRAQPALRLRIQRAVTRPGPRLDGALLDCLAWVRNDQVQIEIDGVTEALAPWACAVRIVE